MLNTFLCRPFPRTDRYQYSLNHKKEIGKFADVGWKSNVRLNQQIFEGFGNFKLPKIFGGSWLSFSSILPVEIVLSHSLL